MSEDGTMVDITDWLRGLVKNRRTAFGEDGMIGCRYDEAASEIERLRLATADRLAPDTAAAELNEPDSPNPGGVMTLRKRACL